MYGSYYKSLGADWVSVYKTVPYLTHTLCSLERDPYELLKTSFEFQLSMTVAFICRKKILKTSCLTIGNHGGF